MADCFLIPPERREGIPNISGWIPKAHFHSELVEFVREGIRNCEPTAKLSIRMMGLLNSFSANGGASFPG
jgi:hypothetical protein